MSRDVKKLRVFAVADELVIDVYRATRGFPSEERFGLQSQMRRGAVSVATNLVEGCTRRTLRDYLHFIHIALGSASEVRYLASVARRLELLEDGDLEQRFDRLVRALQTMIDALEARSL